MKSEELVKLLADKWPPPNCAFIPEFRGGTGWSRESRADALAMHLWPSQGLELHGFELKISRSDWLREMKNPGKADPIKQFCDRWYLVVSDLTVIKYIDELPRDWGLMHVEDGAIRTFKEAPRLSPEPIDRAFLAAMMRRVNKANAV